MANGYIFKILDFNILTSNSHQCQNALERYQKWDPKDGGFITDGRGAWFTITELYETTTHTYYYRQVAFHKLSDIKFFDKNTYDTTIGVVFNKFIAALREYKYAGRAPESIDVRTCLTLITSIIKPVNNLRRNIKICEKVENQGHVFTSHNKIDNVLEYSKVPVTIQSNAKFHSYIKAAAASSYQKDTRSARSRTYATADTATTSEDDPGIKKNPSGTFTLGGKLYPIEAFVPEEIYLGLLPKLFRYVFRENKTERLDNYYETNKTNIWR